MNISRITDGYAVTPQILASDVAAIAAAGFVAVICNRPDGEEAGQPVASDIAAECAKAGLSFHHIPVSGMPVAEDAVQEQRRIIEESDGPVLGYAFVCTRWTRSILWSEVDPSLSLPFSVEPSGSSFKWVLVRPMFVTSLGPTTR